MLTEYLAKGGDTLHTREHRNKQRRFEMQLSFAISDGNKTEGVRARGQGGFSEVRESGRTRREPASEPREASGGRCSWCKGPEAERGGR